MLRFDDRNEATRLIKLWFGDEAAEVAASRSKLQMWVKELRDRGVPEILLSLAMVAAGTFDEIADSSQLYPRIRNLPSTKYDIEQWGRFYEDWRECLRLGGEVLFPGQDQSMLWGMTSLTENCNEGIRWLGKLANPFPKFASNFLNSNCELTREVTDRLAALANIEFDLGSDTEVSGSRVSDSPAVQFLLFVWLPCVLLRGSSPGELLAKGIRDDDVDALDFLLRIDSRLRDQPAVAEVIRHRLEQGNGYFLDVLRGDRARDLSWDRMTIAVCESAALIELSEVLSAAWNRHDGRTKRFGRALTTADMRQLFHAIGFDPQMTKNGQPTEDSAWSTRIRRKRQSWNLSDKFARKFVSDADPG